MTIRILGIRKPVSRFRQRVEVLFSALSILRAKTCRILFVFSLADPFSALSAFQVSTHRSSSFLIPIRKEPNTVTDYNTTLPFSQGTPRFSLRFLPQIANFPRIYCSNSTLLTSFRVPMYKTNGQFGIFSKESILLMPILLYYAASRIVNVILH